MSSSTTAQLRCGDGPRAVGGYVRVGVGRFFFFSSNVRHPKRDGGTRSADAGCHVGFELCYGVEFGVDERRRDSMDVVGGHASGWIAVPEVFERDVHAQIARVRGGGLQRSAVTARRADPCAPTRAGLGRFRLVDVDHFFFTEAMPERDREGDGALRDVRLEFRPQ